MLTYDVEGSWKAGILNRPPVASRARGRNNNRAALFGRTGWTSPWNWLYFQDSRMPNLKLIINANICVCGTMCQVWKYIHRAADNREMNRKIKKLICLVLHVMLPHMHMQARTSATSASAPHKESLRLHLCLDVLPAPLKSEKYCTQQQHRGAFVFFASTTIEEEGKLAKNCRAHVSML